MGASPLLDGRIGHVRVGGNGGAPAFDKGLGAVWPLIWYRASKKRGQGVTRASLMRDTSVVVPKSAIL